MLLSIRISSDSQIVKCFCRLVPTDGFGINNEMNVKSINCKKAWWRIFASDQGLLKWLRKLNCEIVWWSNFKMLLVSAINMGYWFLMTKMRIDAILHWTIERLVWTNRVRGMRNYKNASLRNFVFNQGTAAISRNSEANDKLQKCASTQLCIWPSIDNIECQGEGNRNQKNEEKKSYKNAH